jgi:hypothetical protein
MELHGATTLAVKADSLAPQDIGIGQKLTMVCMICFIKKCIDWEA